jgi:hypothetical protein
MSTGVTFMEDAPRGFGAHSDHAHSCKSELHRFVQFASNAVTSLVPGDVKLVPMD